MINSIPLNEYVTDTMGLVLRIERRRFSSKATKVFEAAEAGGTIVYIPSLVFAEILYLSERRKITLSLGQVADYLKRFPNCKEYPMSMAVIQATAQVIDITDLHDRIIAGTARLLDKALITNDPVIQASSWVKTVW